MAMRFNSPSFKKLLDQMTALVHFVIESNGIYSPRCRRMTIPAHRSFKIEMEYARRPTVSPVGDAQQWAT